MASRLCRLGSHVDQLPEVAEVGEVVVLELPDPERGELPESAPRLSSGSNGSASEPDGRMTLDLPLSSASNASRYKRVRVTSGDSS